MWAVSLTAALGPSHAGALRSQQDKGTFTSTERRIRRLYRVFEPLEGSRPDWQIIQDVANRQRRAVALRASERDHARKFERAGFAAPLGHKDIRLTLAAAESCACPLANPRCQS